MKDGRQLTLARNHIIASATENAVSTIFIEKSAENTLDSFVRIAVDSVLDCIQGNAYELTPKQIESIEAETVDYAREVYWLHI